MVVMANRSNVISALSSGYRTKNDATGEIRNQITRTMKVKPLFLSSRKLETMSAREIKKIGVLNARAVRPVNASAAVKEMVMATAANKPSLAVFFDHIEFAPSDINYLLFRMAGLV